MATYPATVPAVNKYPEMLPKYGIDMRHSSGYTAPYNRRPYGNPNHGV